MTQSQLEQLVDPSKHQVFLFSSPVPFPLNFAVHCWFVISRKTELERWEFGKFKNSPHPNGVGLLKNFLPPTLGMNRYWWKAHPRFSSRMIARREGGQSSSAAKLLRFIKEKSERYPLKDTYSYTGPNSNTYVQWVINQADETGVELPVNAFGKSFRIE